MTDDEIYNHLGKDDVRVIIAFADSDMNLMKAARESFFSRGAVIWHLERVYKRTRLNPRNFYDLAKLVGVIENARHS
jgi:hypothetical protein